MKLNAFNHKATSKVDVLNLMSNDATRLELSSYFLSYVLVAPLQTIAIIYILVVQVDATILSGLCVLVCVILIQLILGRIYNHYK